MFNNSAYCLFYSVTLFGCFAKRVVSAAYFVNATFKAPKTQ